MLAAQTILIIVLIALALGWLLLGVLCPVSGQWERVFDEGNSAFAKERISLGQFGPFVVGRRELMGGYQSYSGFIWGKTLYLKRRDFGVEQLKHQGFPPPIAQKIEGEVLGHLRLSLSANSLFLAGVFVPYKVQFTHTPAKITAILPQPALPRTYRRVQPVENPSVIPIEAR